MENTNSTPHSNPILAQYDKYRKAGMKSKKYQEKHKNDAAKEASDDSEAEDISKPKKSLHRQRAHINPMNDTPYPLYVFFIIDSPLNPRWVDWRIHFPLFYGLGHDENKKIFTNSIVLLNQSRGIPS